MHSSNNVSVQCTILSFLIILLSGGDLTTSAQICNLLLYTWDDYL